MAALASLQGRAQVHAPVVHVPPAAKLRPIPATEFMPREWKRSASDLVTLMAQVVPHEVVSQLHRPFLAECLEIDDIATRCAGDATGWVSTLRMGADRFTTVSVLSLAAQFPKLTDVDLSGTEYDRGILSYLPEIRNIRKLDLGNCPCNDARALAHVAELAHLEILNLQNCELVGAAGIRHVSTLPNLTSLNLYGCPKVDNNCLSLIGNLHRLESLNLASCVKIDAEGLEHLTDLSNLTELNVRGCGNIDSRCLALLSQLSGLRTLRLAFCPLIDAAALEHVGTLPQLRVLDLSGCTLIDTSSVGKMVVKLGRFETLDLSFCLNVRRGRLPVCKNTNTPRSPILSDGVALPPTSELSLFSLRDLSHFSSTVQGLDILFEAPWIFALPCFPQPPCRYPIPSHLLPARFFFCHYMDLLGNTFERTAGTTTKTKSAMLWLTHLCCGLDTQTKDPPARSRPSTAGSAPAIDEESEQAELESLCCCWCLPVFPDHE